MVEGQGGIIDNDFCMVSGFFGGANATTPKIHCIDTQNTKANWVQKVSLQDSDSIEGTKLGTGLSHGADAIVGSRFYLCGGVSHPVAAFMCCLELACTCVMRSFSNFLS